jgi:hypothetical protein
MPVGWLTVKDAPRRAGGAAPAAQMPRAFGAGMPVALTG